MPDQPLVSIIIPTYNRAGLLPETLDSIIAQTYTNWECLLIDDGSTDHTAELIANYSLKDNRISFYSRPERFKPGGNGSRNYGFELSKGKYINWFDSDDIMLPRKLELQVSELERSDKFLNICKAFQFIDKPDVIAGKHDNIYSEDYFLDYLNQELKLLTQAPLFKKELFNQYNIKLFDEDLRAAQEWEMFCRVFYTLPKDEISHLDDYLVAIRKHEMSITMNHSHKKLYQYYLARQKIRKFLILHSDFKYESYFENYNQLYLEDLLRNNENQYLELFLRNEIKKFKNLKTVLNYFYTKIFIKTNKGKGMINFNYYDR